MKLIDGHAHACGAYLDSEGIKQYVEKNNIEKVVLCAGEPHSSRAYAYPILSWIFKGERLAYAFNELIHMITKVRGMNNYLSEGNKIVQDIACQLPGCVIPAYWVNPLDENCLEHLTRDYQAYGFGVIKLHQCWTNFDIEDSRVIEILKWARAHHCAIFIHIFSKKQVEKFIKLANRFQDVKFINAHLIGARMMMKSLKSKNVYFDLSAPQLYSMDTLRDVLDHFGAARLILGSDTPYGINNIDRIVARLRELKVSDGELNYICRKNLLRVLG